MFPSVYQYDHLEEYQTYEDDYPEMNGQLTQPNPKWNNQSYQYVFSLYVSVFQCLIRFFFKMYSDSQIEDVSHSEPTFHKKQHHHFSSQVKQPSQQPGHFAKFPQRNATAAPIVRHPAPAVQTR